MEIKPEKQKDQRLRFLWLLLFANIVLVFGIWQYHRLLVEVSDGAATGLFQRIFRRGSQDTMGGQSLRIALLRSEPTALSFGENRDGYYNLLDIWRRFLEAEGFGYQVVDQVPQGDDAERFNLLLLPAARSMSERDREGVKRFLRSGRGVVMTWATGTRNEYGQWERYSLLQEVAGLDLGPPPPVGASDNLSRVLLSGGYPLTATLYPGTMMQVTAFDQPVAAIVRENRTRIDGVWTNPEDPSFALHSLRDRAAVVHGNYFDGRFAWMGFTIGSVVQAPGQQDAFITLLRSSLLWAGHQVHAFKPVWPGNRMSLLSITQNLFGPEDFDPAIAELCRRYRVPLTTFVHPALFASHPEQVRQLQSLGEIGVLAPRDLDYRARTMPVLQRELGAWRDAARAVLGVAPTGIRFSENVALGEAVLDAAVRVGFQYLTSQDVNRMVPEPVRSYRPIRLIMRPRILWRVPEMPYLPPRGNGGQARNSMMAAYGQIAVLGGYYGLSFRPSALDQGFVEQLETLLQSVVRQEGHVQSVQGVVDLWEGWDNIRISVRHMSPTRASLRISNTWTEEVRDVVINLEMPFAQPELSISAMTLGTRLPDRLSATGVRWRLQLDRLRAGSNVAYYLDVDDSVRPERPQPIVLPGENPQESVREVW